MAHEHAAEVGDGVESLRHRLPTRAVSLVDDEAALMGFSFLARPQFAIDDQTE